MTFLESLGRLVLERRLGDESPDVVVECRRCGTTLDASAETCPVCDSGDVARYEIH